ncbi:MAG: hypothetical protein K0A89_04350 [ANME-2 cluster archaeon]|nr:hypothetical protein [ANME-2 cluster archaeon]
MASLRTQQLNTTPQPTINKISFEPSTCNHPPKHPSPLRTQSPQEESKSACQPPSPKGRAEQIQTGTRAEGRREGAAGEPKMG